MILVLFRVFPSMVIIVFNGILLTTLAAGFLSFWMIPSLAVCFLVTFSSLHFLPNEETTFSTIEEPEGAVKETEAENYDDTTIAMLPRQDTAGGASPSIEDTEVREATSGPLAALPAWWEEKLDASGMTFYINHKTRTTQRQRPELGGEAEVGGEEDEADTKIAIPIEQNQSEESYNVKAAFLSLWTASITGSRTSRMYLVSAFSSLLSKILLLLLAVFLASSKVTKPPSCDIEPPHDQRPLCDLAEV